MEVNSDNYDKVNPASVVVNFLIAFFTSSLGKLNVYWKMYCNELLRSKSQQLLFKVSLFRFHFVSTIQYLNCYYNGYPMKQTASLSSLLIMYKLSLKPAFLLCFCYIGKGKSLLILNLLISKYLDQISPWYEMKEVFLVQLQTGNLYFCLR